MISAHVLIYTACLFAVLQEMPASVIIASGGLGCGLVWASISDFRTQIIPDTLNLLLLGVGIVATHWFKPEAMWVHVLAAAAIYFGLFAASEIYFRVRGVDGFGLGDIKLLAAGTVWLGPDGVASMLLFAVLSAIATLLMLRLRRGMQFQEPMHRE